MAESWGGAWDKAGLDVLVSFPDPTNASVDCFLPDPTNASVDCFLLDPTNPSTDRFHYRAILKAICTGVGRVWERDYGCTCRGVNPLIAQLISHCK